MYKRVLNGKNVKLRFGKYVTVKDVWVSELIRQGTPLPKGHGDLIDRSKLKVHYVGTDVDTDCPVYLLSTVDEAPTIIEADRSVEDE